MRIINIARIANAVQCHSSLSGNKDCHEFRFSIVKIVISVSNVSSVVFVVVIVFVVVVIFRRCRYFFQLSGLVFSSLWTNVWKEKSLSDYTLNVFFQGKETPNQNSFWPFDWIKNTLIFCCIFIQLNTLSWGWIVGC